VPAYESSGATIAYVSFGLLLYTLGYTIFNVPYITMPAEMTDGYHERSSIHAYRVWFVSAGATVGGVLGPVLLEAYGQTRETYSLIAAIKAAIIFATMLMCFFATKNLRAFQRTEAIPPFWTQFRSLLSNHHFLLVITAKFAQLVGVFSMQAAVWFFVLNALQLQERALIIYGLSSTLGAFIFAPLLVRLSKRVGKREAYILCAIINALVALSWYLSGPGESYVLVGLRGFVMGLPFAGNVLLAMSMLTDAIDYDYRKHGVRREGVYTAFYSFVEKLAGAFGPLMVGLLLSAAGFNRDLPPKAAQSPEVVAALLLGMAAIPALSSALAASIIWFFRLDQAKLEQVTREDAAPAPSREAAASGEGQPARDAPAGL